MAGSKKKVIIFAAVFLVLLLIIAPVAAYFIANSQAKSNVAQFTKDFKEICDIKYGSVSYNILNRHLIVEDISLSCSSEKIADIKTAPAAISFAIFAIILYSFLQMSTTLSIALLMISDTITKAPVNNKIAYFSIFKLKNTEKNIT